MGRNTSSKRPIKLSVLIWFLMIELVIQQLIPIIVLANVGPDDGGTAFIPGSHRLTWDRSEMIEAAMSDDSLVCQVEAEAGDILLFPESLIHSTTAIKSDRERTILIAGYTPTMFQPWPGNEVNPEIIYL